MEWTENGVDWKRKWNGVDWKREKSEEWEDEWIMIPPTPLELPVACDDWPYFFYLILFYILSL